MMLRKSRYRIVNRIIESLNDFQFKLIFAARNFISNRPLVWTNDRSHLFQKTVERLPNHDLALIFGNAPNLNCLSPGCIGRIQEFSALRIGINRSFLKIPTNFLLWTDSELWAEMRPEQIQSGTMIVRIVRKSGHPSYIRWWINNRSLKRWHEKGLFFLRNTLVSALDLCRRSGIRRIILFGVSLESSRHFYTSSWNQDAALSYEHHGDAYINKVFSGYDIRRCVREVIESMLSDGYDIRYVGSSRFLDSIGLKGYSSVSALESDPSISMYLSPGGQKRGGDTGK